jgi:hypothetical protein
VATRVKRRFFVGPCPSASADFLAASDEEYRRPLKEADWAQFRECVTGMGEDELELFVCNTAAIHWSFVTPPMSEEEFAVILRHHAAFLRNGRAPTLPLKTINGAPSRGVLVSDDELSAFIRGNHITFPAPTAESEPEARLEALNEAIESGAIETVIEAIESGAIYRKKPGRKPGEQERRREAYFALYRDCLIKNERNIELADAEFVERAMAELNVTESTARNRLSEVKKRLSTDRF